MGIHRRKLLTQEASAVTAAVEVLNSYISIITQNGKE
jgi:hypothetical protein